MEVRVYLILVALCGVCFNIRGVETGTTAGPTTAAPTTPTTTSAAPTTTTAAPTTTTVAATTTTPSGGGSSCPALSDIDNGIVDMSQGQSVEAIAIYSCDEGYNLRGKPTRTCEISGSWGGNEPECVADKFSTTMFAVFGTLVGVLVVTNAITIVMCLIKSGALVMPMKKTKVEPISIEA